MGFGCLIQRYLLEGGVYIFVYPGSTIAGLQMV